MILRQSLAALLLAVLLLVSGEVGAQSGPSHVAVATVIGRSNVSAGQAFVGTIRPKRRSVVGSAVAGRVVEFAVNEGDFVKQGDKLAQLLTNALEIQIAAANAELELRKQELLELKNGARPEELLDAKSRMLAAKATMDFAQKKLDRVRKLLERDAATMEELDDANSTWEAADNLYHAAEANYKLVSEGPRPERIAQAEARVAAATQEVARLEDQLGKHTIKSPFDGYVVTENTEVGQWIESGNPVAELAELESVEVRVTVPEAYVSSLHRGQAAPVELDALPGQSFTGAVTAIVPEADPKSRSFPVQVTLQNSPAADGTRLLKSGMFARVWLRVEQRSNVLLVPKDALVLGGPSPLVYVVEKHGQNGKSTVRAVPVRLGMPVGAWFEVTGQLAAGIPVVVEGNERLLPGGEVLPVPAKIPPPPEADGPPPANQTAQAEPTGTAVHD